MFKYFLAIAVCVGFNFPWWVYPIALLCALHENTVETKWVKGLAKNQVALFKKGRG